MEMKEIDVLKLYLNARELTYQDFIEGIDDFDIEIIWEEDDE